MRKRVWFAFLFWCIATICFAAQKQWQPEQVKTFMLYSWQDAKGGWAFSLLPAIKSAGFHPDLIMRPSSALLGQEKLKRKIAAIPIGSQIYWSARADGLWKDAKGWEQIKYPPSEVIAHIRKYCEEKGMKLSVE
jgi:hypothetical protein